MAVTQLGYTLDPDELEALKKTLNVASDELGMKDFAHQATLEIALTVQSVSPYENVEETVSELINKLSKFCNETYPNVANAMQGFINRTHAAITTTADNVHASLQSYKAQEQEGSRIMGEIHPR